MYFNNPKKGVGIVRKQVAIVNIHGYHSPSSVAYYVRLLKYTIAAE